MLSTKNPYAENPLVLKPRIAAGLVALVLGMFALIEWASLESSEFQSRIIIMVENRLEVGIAYVQFKRQKTNSDASLKTVKFEEPKPHQRLMNGQIEVPQNCSYCVSTLTGIEWSYSYDNRPIIIRFHLSNGDDCFRTVEVPPRDARQTVHITLKN